MKVFSGFCLPLLVAFFTIIVFLPSKKLCAQSSTSPIIGRWDITVDVDGNKVPSWLEVIHSGVRTLVGRFVGPGGSARPISKVNFTDGNMSFSIPPQWEKEDKDLEVTGSLNGDNLSGTMVFSNGKAHSWTAVKAPSLKRNAKPVWGKSIRLFNGKNLDGWHASGKNQWIADSGMLRSPHRGSNLITNKSFNDFKLHIEFRFPPEGNSGVYLRGRYEVQIEDGLEPEPPNNQMGAIYGFIEPSQPLPRTPGKWQSYDITLIGRMLTIVANGITIICDSEIPGITGGAMNSNEAEPGPLLIQGDHESIDFRNIIITPAK
jgi:hypothetical protein